MFGYVSPRLFVFLLVALATVGSVIPASANTDLQPDLEMARLRDLKIETTRDKRRLLRFTTEIVNTGPGAFQVLGTDKSADGQTFQKVQQQLVDGSHAVVATFDTQAKMIYDVGDGHVHYHVQDLETYELKPPGATLETGPLRTGAKRGFCFYDYHAFDRSLPNAPQTAYYNYCGRQDDLSVTMGLSVGWGDIYYSNLAGQYIDITGLKDGQYRLWATADKQGWFTETSNSNNSTWVDIRLQKGSVRVVGYGPAA